MKAIQKTGIFFLAVLLLFGTISFSFPVLADAASTSDFVIEKGVLTKYNGTDETVTIPQGVTSIGEKAFYYKPITKVVFPKSLKSIGNGAFSNTKLSSIDVPEGVTSIGSGAFEECENLSDVKLPKTLSYIGNQAFYYSPWFDSYPEDMLIVNDILVHYYPEDVASVTIPQGVKTINYKAFAHNSGIKTVAIPSSVTTIKAEAFSASRLVSIVIPPSVTVIEGWAFQACDELQSITLSPNTKHLGDNVLADCRKLKSVSIPEGVVSIGEFAFAQDESLRTLTLPNSLTTIGQGLLFNCFAIKELKIPASVTSIGMAMASIDYRNVDPYNPDNRFIIWGYKNTAAERYVQKYSDRYRFCLVGTEPPVIFNPDYNGHSYTSAVMLDTKAYTMAPGNIYDVGVTLLGAASSKTRRMTSSRDGIASVRQLPNGNYRVTALRPGTTYITFTIYNPKDGKTEITHASIKLEVAKGVKQHGVACRQTTYFN